MRIAADQYVGAALVYRANFMQGGAMVSSGMVREYDADEGWGVVDGNDVPGGCWVHFSAIAGPGYRQLSPGEPVSFRAEAADQDGFAFRAVKVWRGDVEPAEVAHERGSSGAYRSRLTLTFDEPGRPDRPFAGA